LSQERTLQRALAQQLASLQAAGVQQLGYGQPVELLDSSESLESSESTGPANTLDSSSDLSPTAAGAVRESPAPALAVMVSDAGDVSTDGTSPSRLSVLSQKIAGCTLCDELCAERTQTVFGVGNPNARLCFLGEAPGADEDRIGEPFVGRAGQLLTKIIEAMGLTRDEVYILNVLKCRPPGNRNPAPDEVTNCRPFFEEQLSIIQPEYICCLGAVAAQNLLDTKTSISRMRGEFRDWKGYKVMATYHPAYLLRNPAAKKVVWEDMQLLLKAMGLEVPTK